MKYALVINAFASDPAKQAQKLSWFLMNNKLDTDDGTGVILYDPKQTDSAGLEEICSFLPVVRVFCVAAAEYLPENFLSYLKETLADMDCILFPGNYFGDELCVRLAARMHGTSLCGVLKFHVEEGKASAWKKIYSGHMNGRFEMYQKPYVLAIEKNDSVSAGKRYDSGKKVFFCTAGAQTRVPELTKRPVRKDAFLEDARCITVGGRGLKNKENTEEMDRLARSVSIPFAGSRPCVMSAWLPMDRLIGVSGIMVSPTLSILLGISGAPALYSGVEKSRYIIAVNHDIDAPVMKKADLAICGDCIEVFRMFVQIVQENQNENKSDPTHFG